MATIKLVLDKRTRKKDGTFPIRLYLYHKKKTHFVTLGPSLNAKDYKDIFEKVPTGKRLEYRRSLEEFANKAIDVYKNMNPFDIKVFKRLLFEQQNDTSQEPLSLTELFRNYLKLKGSKIALKTQTSYKTALNCILRFKPHANLEDVTVSFLEDFEKWYNNTHKTELNASVGIHLRNLRAVINKAKADDILPTEYKYPFGKGNYNIKSILKPKVTLMQNEIKSLVELNEFESSEERKARDYWLMQYYCNGINFNDLIRLRWDNKIGNCFVIRRQKTKNTTSSRPIFIKIPLIEKLKSLIDIIGDKNSPYVLGLLTDGMTERQIQDKKERVAYVMNPLLKRIGTRLNLSIELLSETSRDAYATTLKRNGRSIEEIAETLGQSSIACTRNYLGQFDESKIMEINSSLL